MRRHAAAIEQRERAARADPAQVDRSNVAPCKLRTIVKLGDAGDLGRTERLKKFCHRRRTPRVELTFVDDGHRQRRLGINPADIGAGNGEHL